VNPDELALTKRLIRHLEKQANGDHPETLHPTDPGKTAGLELIAAGTRIYFDADDALHRAHDYGGRGYAGGNQAEGRGKGGHTSPTESAATLDHSMPGIPDDFTAAGQQLRRSLTDATGMAGKAKRQAERIMSTAPPKTEADKAKCRTIECGDLDVKAGHCATCFEWRRTHDGREVPAAVIEARRHGRTLTEA